MKFGFTGTRHGMTPGQMESVKRLFELGKPDLEVHHGDCIGADEEAHDIAGRVNAIRIVHPPVDPTHRANVACYNEIREPLTHFARNRAIVDETSALIATPWQAGRPTPKTGGGTWYTIEYAEKQGKRVYIVWRDGRITDGKGVPSLYCPSMESINSAPTGRGAHE